MQALVRLTPLRVKLQEARYVPFEISVSETPCILIRFLHHTTINQSRLIDLVLNHFRGKRLKALCAVRQNYCRAFRASNVQRWPGNNSPVERNLEPI